MEEEKKEKVLSYFEEHPDSVLFPVIAELKLNSGDIPEAIEICKKGTQKHPDKAIGHYIYSRALRKANMLEKAVEELKKTIACDHDFLQAYYDLLEIGGNHLTEEEKRYFGNRIRFLNPFEKEEIQPEAEPVEESPEEISAETTGAGELEQSKQEKIEEIFEEPAEVEEPPFSIVSGEIPEEEAHLGPLEKEEKTEQEETPEPIKESPHEETESVDATKLRDMFEKLKTRPLEELQKESWDIKSTETEKRKEPPAEPEPPEKEPEKETPEEPPSEKGKPEEGFSEKPQELEVPIPTFTLVEILMKQKLYDQALEVLKVLEKRRKDLERVKKYREEILRLKEENR